MNDPKITLDML